MPISNNYGTWLQKLNTKKNEFNWFKTTCQMLDETVIQIEELFYHCLQEAYI
jgi:hypothetical protein